MDELANTQYVASKLPPLYTLPPTPSKHTPPCKEFWPSRQSLRAVLSVKFEYVSVSVVPKSLNIAPP